MCDQKKRHRGKTENKIKSVVITRNLQIPCGTHISMELATCILSFLEKNTLTIFLHKSSSFCMRTQWESSRHQMTHNQGKDVPYHRYSSQNKHSFLAWQLASFPLSLINGWQTNNTGIQYLDIELGWQNWDISLTNRRVCWMVSNRRGSSSIQTLPRILIPLWNRHPIYPSYVTLFC